MTCPSCGSPVQTTDHFCLSCGHPLQPADPTGRLNTPATPAYAETPPSYGDTPPIYGDNLPDYGDTTPAYRDNLPDYGDTPPSYGGVAGQFPSYTTPPAYAPQPAPVPTYEAPPPSYAPRPTQTPSGQGSWSSGSSFPATNPYNPIPNTVSPGTVLNGRPLRSGRNGLAQGLGGILIAIVVGLKAFGHALAGIGFAKFFFFAWLFSPGSFFGPVLLIIVIVAIVGAIMRSRTA